MSAIVKGILVPGIPHPLLVPEQNEGWQHLREGFEAARQELQQIYNLASRYGVDALGTPGFTLEYVRGLLAYREAREAHGGDRPVVQNEQLALYGAALSALKDALLQSDDTSDPWITGRIAGFSGSVHVEMDDWFG